MPEPLRVLYCVPIGERGGVERFLEDVIVRHDPDRVKPAVLAFAGGRWLRELAARDVKVYCLEGMHMRQPWRVFRRVDEILKKERIDMVHSAYSWCHGLSSPAAVWNGCKRVWFHHGPMSSSTWQGATPLFPADLVLVNSNFLGQMLKRTLYVAKKTAVMPYGIEASRLQPDGGRRAAFRKQWGLEEQDVAVGIVGFIDHWKGQDVFLDAIRQLRERAPRLRAFVVGGPRGGVVAEVCEQFQDKLKTFVKEHGLEDVVAFTGHVDVREGALDGLDIFVHASTQPEPFGMEILEAAGAQDRWTLPVSESNFGFHLLGTCRMGKDPKTAVIDTDHRTHDVPNLFLCDGSSFVTSGRGQPTETIYTLAFRASDRITALARKNEI